LDHLPEQCLLGLLFAFARGRYDVRVRAGEDGPRHVLQAVQPGWNKVEWDFGDIFIAPSWRWIEHRAEKDAQIFSMSDEPLLRWAQYYMFQGA